MTVSVIIPAKNAANYLEQTLQSVLSQSMSDLDVVVVDDGSTDATREIAGKFSTSRVRLIDGAGKGAASARNIGFRAAMGELVMFLDADDVLSPQKIALQVTALAGDSEAIATCAWRHFSDSPETAVGHEEPCWRESVPLRWLQQSLSGGGMFQTACWLASRALLDKAGPWDERLSLHDDGEYFCRVLLQSREIRFADGCYVGYRQVAGSLSRRRSRQAAESAFRVCELRAQALLARDESATTRRALATQWLQFVYEFGSNVPDLSGIALERLIQLQIAPVNCVGGRTFRLLASLFGSRRALHLRKWLASMRPS